jgi:hypothetical protein
MGAKTHGLDTQFRTNGWNGHLLCSVDDQRDENGHGAIVRRDGAMLGYHWDDTNGSLRKKFFTLSLLNIPSALLLELPIRIVMFGTGYFCRWGKNLGMQNYHVDVLKRPQTHTNRYLHVFSGISYAFVKDVVEIVAFTALFAFLRQIVAVYGLIQPVDATVMMSHLQELRGLQVDYIPSWIKNNAFFFKTFCIAECMISLKLFDRYNLYPHTHHGHSVDSAKSLILAIKNAILSHPAYLDSQSYGEEGFTHLDFIQQLDELKNKKKEIMRSLINTDDKRLTTPLKAIHTGLKQLIQNFQNTHDREAAFETARALKTEIDKLFNIPSELTPIEKELLALFNLFETKSVYFQAKHFAKKEDLDDKLKDCTDVTLYNLLVDIEIDYDKRTNTEMLETDLKQARIAAESLTSISDFTTTEKKREALLHLSKIQLILKRLSTLTSEVSSSQEKRLEKKRPQHLSLRDDSSDKKTERPDTPERKNSVDTVDEDINRAPTPEGEVATPKSMANDDESPESMANDDDLP